MSYPVYDVIIKKTYDEQHYICGVNAMQNTSLTWDGQLGIGYTIDEAYQAWKNRITRWLKTIPDDFNWPEHNIKPLTYCIKSFKW